MTDETPNTDPSPQRPRWPWAVLALAMVWVALVRVPLVLNAESHLDSDLAVDGLTLIEALRGDWRPHYPGTPHIGTPSVLLSLPQAMVWGANPEALVSGGVVAYELVVLATFLLAWRGFGPVVAAWSLVPLAFASIGTVWLSGRITGGHLLATAWHAGAFAMLVGLLRRGGIRRAVWLGLWCGLGLYVDQMVVFSLAGILPGAIAGGFGPGKPAARFVAASAFAIGGAAGYAAHIAAVKADGYDAYETAFATIFGDERTGQIDWERTGSMAREHARLLVLECLPRLVGGHRLPGFQSDPAPEELRGRPRLRDPADYGPLPIAATLLGLGSAAASVLALALARRAPDDAAAMLLRWGLLASSLAVIGGFILNRNIYNSDNYRYLVFLLVPVSTGFGLLGGALEGRGRRGRIVAVLMASALAIAMTLDTARWYRAFGWIDGSGIPIAQPPPDPALHWLRSHPEVTRLYGGYWDVYRLSFLTGGRVLGVPYPEYPNRFPDLSDGLPAHRPRLLLARPDPIGRFNRELAERTGGKTLEEGRGFAIVDWPRGDE
jgi:hypothetical protein